jgi:hypothetical protein
MAIDIHGLNFLHLAAKETGLGRTATIGRQSLAMPKETIRKLLNLEATRDFGPFCEDLLKAHFGSTIVDSWDYSDFEGATCIADLNKPLVTVSGYDTVIDCGSLEHIYNAPEALKNLSLMCAEGGRILHVLPSNNYCGHGFWQFSPELFFSLYSQTNGYQGTRVFLAGIAPDRWYEVKPPDNGRRVDITSATKLLILVTTRRMTRFRHENVQQSDYVHAWSGAPARRNRNPSQVLLGSHASLRRDYFLSILNSASLLPLVRVAWDLIRAKTTLSSRNPQLIRHSVRQLLRTPADAMRTVEPPEERLRERSAPEPCRSRNSLS